MRIIQNIKRALLPATLCAASLLLTFISFPSRVQASSSAKIHYITLPGNTEAILLECNGKFGMVDSGEDNDYPSGNDSRYPMRDGIVIGAGYEDYVISYLRSVGVTKDNFEFYIGTHPHSDHIGSADEIIRAFTPKRVYIQEYKDSYLTGNLWDNLYVYDHMIEAARETGATLIQNFDPAAPLYPEKVSFNGTIQWDDSFDQDGIRPSKITVQLENPSTGEKYTQTVSSNKTDLWNYTFDNLPKYDEDKNPIAYQVTAQTPEGYTLTVDNSCNLIFQHSVSVADDSVTITWLGDANVPSNVRPASLNLTLQQYVPEESKSLNLPSSSTADSSISSEPDTEFVWTDVLTFDIGPNASGSWIYSLEDFPKSDEDGLGISYRLVVNNPPADYTYTEGEDPFSLIFSYTGSATISDLPEGIVDTETESANNTGTSDQLSTAAVPASDQVDPNNINDPTNQVSGQASARTGRYETLSDSLNTTSTPSFTLGNDMEIEIMHYGGDYKTNPKPDANYFCLGVKVTANGKTAFLGGDINNYEGAETALAASLGHVDILTLGHHGYYGSNTYGYVTGLNPQVMILAGDFTGISNDSSNGEIGTLDTLLTMADRGSRLYATAWYSNTIPALVFHLDSALSSNIPADFAYVAWSQFTTPNRVIYYKNGLPTNYSGWLSGAWGTYHFSNSPYPDTNRWIQDAQGRYSYVDDSGAMKTGWFLLENTWYYADSNGFMQTGWIKLEDFWYYLSSDGSMVTGAKKIDGSSYYFNSSGQMIVSAWVNGKYYGSDGKWIPGYKNKNWRHDSNGWWYQYPNGSYPHTQWEYIDGSWYYFNSAGYMLTGWLNLGGTWYYLNSSGQMLTGWQFINGSWYYMNGSGAMLTGWQLINGIWYYLNASGAMTTGWLFQGNTWYYLNASGQMATGWIYVNGTWYLMNSSGAMLTGWQLVNGTWYYMNASGAMLTGWQLINGSWYYMNGSGAMLTGWQLINGSWYYMNSSGAMLTGWQFIGGAWYYMNSSGAMTTGWQLVNGAWYYMNGSGAMLTGWQFINGQWYYMNGSGAMLTGWQLIGGAWYYMNGSGAMLTGTHSIGGTTYHFAGSGAWIG